MYKLSNENVEKLVGALDYYIEKVSDLENYEVAKQNMFITGDILRILERYSGNDEKRYNFNTVNYANTTDDKQ